MITIVINPLSGSRGNGQGRQRARLARRLLDARRVEARVLVSEYAGHAVELTRRAVADGATLVCAWGGDGTINEVARVLAHTNVPLGVVPEGSGNGFARDLGLLLPPDRALAVALEGREITLDAGELGGRLFFNVAGVGLDARIAALFNGRTSERRGFWRYVALGWRELLACRAEHYRLEADGERLDAHAMMVVLANLRQYGSGACIAPRAAGDDGRLDLVVVGVTSTLRAFLLTPRLFAGTLDRARDIQTRQVTRTTIASVSKTPLLCHVDGEAFEAGTELMGRVRPKALRVRIPR